MSQITITISKDAAMEEAMRTSAYIGKKSNDITEYDRKALVSHDKDELSRYWNECKTAATERLSQLVTEDAGADDYTVTLSPSLSWNSALAPAVETSLRGFLVNGMLARWLIVTDPAGAQAHAATSASMLESAERMLYRLKRPERRV